MIKEKVRYDKIYKQLVSVCGDVYYTVQGGCTYGDDNQVKATEQYFSLCLWKFLTKLSGCQFSVSHSVSQLVVI